MEAKERAEEQRHKEALTNKANKDKKHDAKKDTERDNNTEELEKVNDKLNNIEVAIVKVIRTELTEAVKELGKSLGSTIAEAVKDAVKDASAESNLNSPLSTQNIIKDAEAVNRRLNSPIQPTRNITPEDQPKITKDIDKHESPADQKIPTIYPVITREELIKTINVLINKVNHL